MSVPFAVLRHASTDWNVARRLQGLTDTPLNAAGEADARALAPAIAGRWLAAIQQPIAARAPHRRAAAALGAGHRRFGAARDELRHLGRPHHRRAARSASARAFIAAENKGLDFQPPGGESPRAAMARIGRWTASIAANGEPVVAVSHKATIRALLALATGWDMMGRPPHKLDWRCLHFFSAHADGRVSIDRLNVPL